jgi:hypothetical protein
MESEFYISGVVSEEDSERGPFAVVCSHYVDGNLMDVYGEDAEHAEAMAQAVIAKMDASAEIERLREAIHDAANKVFFMPTWVDGDSYRAQIDMRKRCYEVVAALVKID